MNNPLISAAQLASILQITEDTINGFAKKGQIPYTQFNIGQASTVALFNPQHVIAWMLKVPTMENMNDYLLSLRKQIQEQCPEALKALQDFDSHIASPRKGFCLVKVPNKKHGFLYYVRYTEKGKTLPSRWNTHTNDKHLAELFAKENRARILADYHAKKQQKNNLYTILTNYYKADSPYLAVDKQRGRILSDRIRGLHYRFIVNTFIPFLKERHINGFDGITPPLMVAFQNYLLAKNLKPRTVNDYMRGVSAVFAHLTMTGVIPANVFKTMERLEVKQDDSASRGCHDISKVQGVFDKTWEDLQSYLLCLIIYTTGMRNREIEKIQVKDSIACGDTMFIDIPRSKTKSGIRIVPVHPFVNEKLRLYIEGTGKGAEDYLFSKEGGDEPIAGIPESE